jgi:SAM-dependent methyltransferase
MIAMAKKLLERPGLFDLYQASVGANHAKQVFVREWVRPEPGQRVLDIGCGTGAVVPFLPQGVDLVGIDISEDYIAAARTHHARRGTFLVADAADPAVDLGGGFDVAYAFGVIHHLPDDAALRLVEGALSRLKPGGHFVSIDPVLVDGQGAVAKFFVSNDRGEFVRTKGELQLLFGGMAQELAVRTDLLRIPYAQALMRFVRS